MRLIDPSREIEAGQAKSISSKLRSPLETAKHTHHRIRSTSHKIIEQDDEMTDESERRCLQPPQRPPPPRPPPQFKRLSTPPMFLSPNKNNHPIINKDHDRVIPSQTLTNCHMKAKQRASTPPPQLPSSAHMVNKSRTRRDTRDQHVSDIDARHRNEQHLHFKPPRNSQNTNNNNNTSSSSSLADFVHAFKRLNKHKH